MREPDYLRVSEVAFRCSVSEEQVRGWIADGRLVASELPSRGFGHRTHYRISRDDYYLFLESWKIYDPAANAADRNQRED